MQIFQLKELKKILFKSKIARKKAEAIWKNHLNEQFT